MPKELLEGLQHFMTTSGGERLRELAEEGQHPTAFVISCMDSRCNPGIVFESLPGKFFAHSPMGAIIPAPSDDGHIDELKAKLRYAIDYVGIEDILIIGHTGCGAVKAMVDHLEDPDIEPWVNVAQNAFDRAHKTHCNHSHNELLAEAERQTVIESFKNLRQYPVIEKALEDGRIDIHVWMLDIHEGNVRRYCEDTGEFVLANPNDYDR